ncbi:MAG: hypothetical protein R3F17_01425 [Planctomycetota bacterium]
MRSALLILACLPAACATTAGPPPVLGSARVVSDIDSYSLRRIGLLPLEGMDPTLAESREMAMVLGAEFAARTGLEVLVMQPSDLTEVTHLEPHRLGRFEIATVIELGRRHRLDALLVPSLIERRGYPPQRLTLQVDLVSTETGMSLWFGQVQADAGEGRTQEAVEYWVESENGERGCDWQVVLLSPKRFYRFVCHQLLARFQPNENPNPLP